MAYLIRAEYRDNAANRATTILYVKQARNSSAPFHGDRKEAKRYASASTAARLAATATARSQRLAYHVEEE